MATNSSTLSLSLVLTTIIFFNWVNANIANFNYEENLQNKLVYAVNCGGKAHLDSNNIYYDEDPYLKSQPNRAYTIISNDRVRRIPEDDYYLYKTVRMNESVTYELPIEKDDEYNLILKFLTWKPKPEKKQDIFINGVHKVATDFDVYEKATNHTAYDELIKFKVKNNVLTCNGGQSNVVDKKISVDFVQKVDYDFAHVSAILLVKGYLDERSKIKLPAVYRAAKKP